MGALQFRILDVAPPVTHFSKETTTLLETQITYQKILITFFFFFPSGVEIVIYNFFQVWRLLVTNKNKNAGVVAISDCLTHDGGGQVAADLYGSHHLAALR